MDILRIISVGAIPFVLLFIFIYAIIKNVPLYDEFMIGVKEGLSVIVKILPPVLGILFAIEMLKSSGLLDFILFSIKPVTAWLHIPPELTPLMILRPISGSGSLALVSDLLKSHGPDSFLGKTASTLMGSTETTFYAIAVYFGVTKVKNIKYTLKAALIADLVGMIASIFIWTLLK